MVTLPMFFFFLSMVNKDCQQVHENMLNIMLLGNCELKKYFPGNEVVKQRFLY